MNKEIEKASNDTFFDCWKWLLFYIIVSAVPMGYLLSTGEWLFKLFFIADFILLLFFMNVWKIKSEKPYH